MLSAEKNDLITRTGPQAPAGALLRRYWQPAALVEELQGDRPLVHVRLLGEDLVLFRGEGGGYGLLGRRCCHRGADLTYGRLENGGLRCPFHGWLFDAEGRCLEQPGEPDGSTFHTKVRQPAYPCRERNGIVFAYLGPGEPPALPDYDCFAAPDAHTFSFKGFLDCNWLQALEVGIDPAHASFLHRFFEDQDTAEGYGRQFRAATADADIPVTKILRDFPNPRIEVEETAYGLRVFALRTLGSADMHVRVTNLAFPNAFVIPLSYDMAITQWHVPIDDEHNWWYAIFTSYRDPVDKAAMRQQRLEEISVPDYMPRRNRANNYGFDPDEQRGATYTGMGMHINVHDQWAVESLGPIQDRTIEHLATTDKAITAYRRLLVRAIDAVGQGGAPPMFVPGGGHGEAGRPVAVDMIAPVADWQASWRDYERDRRRESRWAGLAAAE